MPKVSPEYLAARRAQIIETARELFSRKGLSDTSMSDLVAASGMSIGAIYRYFASKDKLVAAVAEGRDGTVEGDFPVAESPGDILARLLSYVSAPAGVEHGRLTAQIWGSAAVQPALAEIARTRHASLRPSRCPHPRHPPSRRRGGRSVARRARRGHAGGAGRLRQSRRRRLRHRPGDVPADPGTSAGPAREP
jgi:AcrR family transcriptional regulator